LSVSWRNIGSDTFDRADNGFGNIDGGEKSGAAWAALAGTWVIDTNRGGATTAGQSVIVVDLGECDGEVYVTVETASDDGGLVARAVDNNNYLVLAFNATGDTVKLWKQVATVWTALTGDLAVTDGVDNGSVIKLILRGSTIVIVVDDVWIGSAVETDHQTATKHGVQENAAGAKSFYDDFGFRRREQREPSMLVVQNMGVEVLDPKDAPSTYPAQNIGLEVKTSAQPTLYLEQNTGDYDVGSVSDQHGPEFAFPPRIEFLIPSYGREASTVKLEGVGFGDECTFLRFGQDDAFDAGGDYDAPGTGYARGSVDQTSGTWTLELWFRSQLSGKYGTAARESDGSLVELCDYNAGSPIVRYTVELLDGRVNARIGASSCALTPDYYDDGRMHHVRVVYTGGSLNLLVDGVFIGSGVGADNAIDWIRLAGISTHLRADIREVRLCHANLGTTPYDSDDEWTPAPHGSDVGLWHCDDGSGTTVTDSSGEGNDLDLQGDDWLWIDWDFALQIYLGVGLCGGPTEVRNLGCAFTIPVGADTGQIKAKHTQVHVDESNTKTFTVLPEVPLRGTGYEVRIYDRDNYGTLLAILENAYDVGGQHELNQAGAGQFNLHASDAKATATIIRHGNLCRIYWEGLERYAFIIEQIAEILIAEGDETAQVYMCSGRGVQTLLDHALVYPPSWPTREPYKTNYAAKTVGYIIKDQVDKAIARGALTNFSYDFDATTDSQGTLWPETFDLDLEPGVTLWSVIQQFVSLGYDVHLGSDLELHIYVTRGLDRTVGDDPVIFRQGHNLFAKQRDSSSAEVKTHALVAGADTLSEFAKASVFPRRETFMDARSADSVGTAQKTAAMTLELLCIEDIGFAAEVVSIEGCSEVFEDFNIGDWVLVDVPGKLDLVSYRIRGITMSVGEDDKAHWVVDFNSIRHEWGVRLKRMLDAMTGGSLRGETGSGRTEGVSPTTMVDTAGGKGVFECVVKITVDDAAAFKVQDTSLNVVFLVDTVAQEVKIPTTLLVDTIDEYTPDAGVTIEGVKALDSFLELSAIAKPDDPAAGYGRLYMRNHHLYWLNDGCVEHDIAMPFHLINKGVYLDHYTVVDEGGLDITWGAGSVWDHTNEVLVSTTAEVTPQACTNNAVNYLKWVSGTTLTLNTTCACGDEVEVAHIICAGGDILAIHYAVAMNKLLSEIAQGLGHIFPVVVANGLIISEDTDVTNPLDVVMSAGEYAHMHFENVITAAPVYSRTVNLRRWYHSGGNWTSDTDPEIDPTKYDNGTNLVAVAAGSYYKSTFYTDGVIIYWVYPQEAHANIAKAIAGDLPTPPASLTELPVLTAVVMKGSDTTFPGAGDRWIDIRPMIGRPAFGPVTDHGDLGGLLNDDHAQYALLLGRLGDTLKMDDIVEFTANAGVTVENVVHLDGFIELNPVGDPAASTSGVRLYCKEVALQPYLYMKRDNFAPQRLVGYGEVINLVETEAALDLLGNVTITESKSLGVATIIEKVADAGVSVEGVRALDSFLELDEISTPANPAADKGRLYSKDVGGATALYWRRSDGSEIRLDI